MTSGAHEVAITQAIMNEGTPRWVGPAIGVFAVVVVSGVLGGLIYYAEDT